MVVPAIATGYRVWKSLTEDKMKNWFISLNGALTLSVVTLLSEMWRGFLDAMFVFPTDIADEVLMNLAAVIFTVLFGGWAWSLVAAGRGSRRGVIAAFALNALVLLMIPVSWLFFYCPAECRAEAGIFNLANTLNLLFGSLAAVSLGLQLRQDARPAADSGLRTLSQR
jgi:hypothetical protein